MRTRSIDFVILQTDSYNLAPLTVIFGISDHIDNAVITK